MSKFSTSIRYALDGIRNCFLHEAHFKVHSFFSLAVLLAAYILKVSAFEWLILLLCIGMVLMAELFNTALEILCNIVHKEKHQGIKLIKDIAAGAVLITAMIAATAGAIIFIPKIFIY